MANAIRGNKIYIDSTGSVSTDVTTKIAYVVLTPSSNNQTVVFKETSDGNPVLSFQNDANKASLLFDFSRKPIVFNNGIFIASISSGLVVMLITTTAGG